MTTYTHKENQTVKNYGEVLREFTHLRATDDDFKREYRSTEVDRYIQDIYTAQFDGQKVTTNDDEYNPFNKEGYKLNNFEGWVERLDNILLELENNFGLTHSYIIDKLANVIEEMKKH